MDRPVNTVLGWRLPGWLLDYGPVAFILLTGLASNYGHPPAVPWSRAMLALLIVVVALARRHHSPILTLAIVVSVALVTDYKAVDALPVLLAVFNVVEYTPRKQMIAAIVVTAIAIIAGPELHGVRLAFPGILSRLVAVGMAVSVALYLRARADYIHGLRDRAERLEREQQLLAGQSVTEERVRIARELHDVVAHNVSLMVVQAQALAATGNGGAEAEALHRIGDLGREAMSEMHRMLGVLRLQNGSVAERAPQPGVRDLPALISRTQEAGVQTEFVVRGLPRELSPGIDLSIYRIVQEALTNVIRHAHAEHVSVALSYEPRAIEVEIVDDGEGPAPSGGGGTPAGAGGGHGLVGMRERTGMLGGELIAGARTDGSSGYRVHAVLPAQ